ncbi:LpxL/LpxP family acyltransferase [Desulfonatronum thiodismutans]|uniref:LpxL/LpxP family acyltransferase n=1 Tax=Desulfonatronum thiodismutans TaxID=159290 RepID=UPI0004ABD607|nr:lipid A biosynthesis acyltransferase [Desulfonatronum thiodismutans]
MTSPTSSSASSSASASASSGGSSAWSSRSIAARWQHQFFYLAIRLGGRRLAYAWTYPVVAYYLLFRPRIRARTRHYLSRRFPTHTGFQAFTDSFRLSLSFAQALVDRARAGILGPESMAVRFNGFQTLRELLDQGRGLILMGAHVGCWQAAMSGLNRLQVPTHLLMQRDQGDVDRHYHEHKGLESPYRIIDPNGFLGGAVEIVQALGRGEIVSVMGDRIFGHDQNHLDLPFLGESAAFPVGAYKIAATTGAPVAVLFSNKTGPDAYALNLARVIQVPQVRDRRLEALRPFALEFVESLETYSKDYPYQFYNFHDMWSTPR